VDLSNYVTTFCGWDNLLLVGAIRLGPYLKWLLWLHHSLHGIDFQIRLLLLHVLLIYRPSIMLLLLLLLLKVILQLSDLVQTTFYYLTVECKCKTKVALLQELREHR